MHSRECERLFQTHLHQVSESMLRQLCDDANNPALIENNEWGCNLSSSDSIVFNQNSITSVIAEFCPSIVAEAWCKQALLS